jgi:Cdc6-like AAA superfamily ATPase
MTQEDIFRESESGFTVGYKLPDVEGNLEGFKLIRIEARKGDTPAKVVNRLIEAFGYSPVRDLLRRAEQLSALVGSYIDRGIRLIFIIDSADLLTRRTIYSLKMIGESGTQPFPPVRPGFILLGRPEKIQATVNEDPSVGQRSARLPTLIRLIKSSPGL